MIQHRSIFTGGPTLHGLYAPARSPVADLLFLHGYGDHAMRYAHAFDAWSSAGISVHALDFRGHGVSTGQRGFVRQWKNYQDDLLALIHQPPWRDSNRPRFIVGHSHGGLVAAAGLIDKSLSADGLILVAPYLRAAHPVIITKRILAHIASPILPALRVGTGLHSDDMTRDTAMQDEARHDTLLLRKATPRWFLGMQKAQRQVMARAGELATPLLLLTGTADTVSDARASKAFVASTGSTDRTEQSHPDARHELLRETNRAQVIGAIADWILARA